MRKVNEKDTLVATGSSSHSLACSSIHLTDLSATAAAATQPPSYEPPSYKNPSYENPSYEPPSYENPSYENPSYENPSYENPSYENPSYENPSYECVAHAPSGQAHHSQGGQGAPTQEFTTPDSLKARLGAPWFIVGIISTLCCLPCAFFGLYFGFASRKTSIGEFYRKKLVRRAQWLIAAAVTLAIVEVIAVIIAVVVTLGVTLRSTSPPTTSGYSKEGLPLTHFTYVGCYPDRPGSRDLAYESSRTVESVNSCVSICLRAGYKYAGIQEAAMCFCGDSYGSHGRGDARYCDMRCDDGNECGGILANSVYLTTDSFSAPHPWTTFPWTTFPWTTFPRTTFPWTTFPRTTFPWTTFPWTTFPWTTDIMSTSPSPTTIPSSEAHTSVPPDYKYERPFFYAGCYKMRDYPEKGIVEFGRGNVVVSCVEYCANKGFFYAGVQNTTQCFCTSNFIKSFGRRSDNECSYRCLGVYQSCGGKTTNSMYRTPFGMENYQGCFKKLFSSYNRIRTEFTNGYNSVTQCVGFCSHLGYNYASLQATICECGNYIYPPYEQDGRLCSIGCVGDKHQMCGGAEQLSVYDTRVESSGTENISANVDRNYLGCYNYSMIRNDFRFGHAMSLSNGSVAQCMAFCSQTNAASRYVGLMRDYCACTDKLQPYHTLNERDCNFTCVGDYNYCGSDSSLYALWNISVYQIQAKESYLGCYTDKVLDNFIEIPVLSSAELNSNGCSRLCYEQGFNLAGLQLNRCYCGDELNSKLERATSECDITCTGEYGRCGGERRLSVYNSSEFAASTADNPNRTYIGCYDGTPEDADLSRQPINLGINNRISSCSAHCTAYGYSYIVLREGTRCSCGDKFHRRRILNDKYCTIACPGRNYSCGGSATYSVYEIDIPGHRTEEEVQTWPNIELEYLGCYKDQESSRDVDNEPITVKDYNPPLLCLTHCNSKGYRYAALAEFRCTCGNQYGQSELDVDANCNHMCVKKDREECWLPNRYEVYQKKKFGFSNRSYLGCFEVQPGQRDLNGAMVDFGDSNDVGRCIEYCSMRGFKYAGLQSRTKCLCGNSYGYFGGYPDNMCDLKCPANESNTCGGNKINSIYRTNYIGCFKDTKLHSLSHRVWLPDFMSDLPTCLNFCEREGYMYGALQDGYLCYCGDDFNRYIESPQFDCQLSPISLASGGTWRNSVVRTRVAPKSLAYLGCYRGVGDEISKRYVIKETDCVEYCGVRGYNYAGLREASCFCGDDYAGWTDLAGDCERKLGVKVWRTPYLGCFYDGLPRALGDRISLQTLSDADPSVLDTTSSFVTQCIRLCGQSGFNYAGVVSLDDCYCGNDPNRYGQTESHECFTTCTGDNSAECNRISVYQTDT